MPDFGTFVLRYFQDLSIKEIASIVDIPEGTVKSLLSNGLKELRKLMKDGVRGDENL
ncbi:MAG TPA: RNA polymerase sigma factor [Hungateiclostridium thermocellum]|jgi:RNA polymerase sigma-70 factor (ECF subfamily)|uniref:RNA polymerase sigma factor n=1 Tax=Acetivibrio thermocellus TaxID=1515 RepID=UPI000038F577|nr:RNA polymerase sigma factor [Acetivibrio thermocellus]NLU26163.1 RNA polymerase sigma factor [Acetivibrio thermocellus]THJ78444.1 RNA polymerase sigma factor [Acetivibrio thermocellus]UWV46150.1 RNA polymerase sigma factor [Acetivibrio thermocellus]HBW26701.1 RNA polymerase sigma factor [Acetivibrio thermocellus]HOP94081.1 RNA polymerase sigma factor [Acetivibrio thermocellus]